MPMKAMQIVTAIAEGPSCHVAVVQSTLQAASAFTARRLEGRTARALRGTLALASGSTVPLVGAARACMAPENGGSRS